MSKILKENNLKNTKGRELILETIKKASLPISAEDVYNLVNKKASLNLSTVYRTLATLLEKGVLINQIMHDKKSYYQINNLAHKHILVCEICHSQTPIKDCPMHHLEDKIKNETGFTIKSHNLEIIGICAKCNKKLNK
jgi:Fur family transcriptional regulator, ferric uptake regulator